MIANPAFGFQVSAEGGGYTWSGNSRENQLTPWSNDPVGDRPGEVFYVRDEDGGALWGPTALPIREETGQYVARHGQGYSRFEHTSHGISLELSQYVAPGDPIKISRLRIQNRSARTRRLSVTAYVEWVLAAARDAGGTLHRDRDRRGDGSDARAQSVEHRLRGSRGLRGSRRATARLDGRPDGVPRPQRRARSAGRARGRRAALESGRRRPRSLRLPCKRGSSSSRTSERRSSASSGRRPRTAEARSLITRYRTRRPRRGLPRGGDGLGRRPRHGSGEDARPVHGRPAEPLAALPDARLPGVGALGLLPGERRLRLPRPAPGCDGAHACRSRR